MANATSGFTEDRLPAQPVSHRLRLDLIGERPASAWRSLASGGCRRCRCRITYCPDRRVSGRATAHRRQRRSVEQSRDYTMARFGRLCPCRAGRAAVGYRAWGKQARGRIFRTYLAGVEHRFLGDLGNIRDYLVRDFQRHHDLRCVHDGDALDHHQCLAGHARGECRLYRARSSAAHAELESHDKNLSADDFAVFFSGARLAFGFGWRVSLVAETIGSSSGVGYRLRQAADLIRTDQVFAWTLTLVIMMATIEMGMLKPLENYLFRWKKGAEAQ